MFVLSTLTHWIAIYSVDNVTVYLYVLDPGYTPLKVLIIEIFLSTTFLFSASSTSSG